MYHVSLRLQSEVTVLRNTQAEWFQKYFGEKPRGVVGVLGQAQRKVKDYSGGVKRRGKKVKRYVPVMDVLYDIMGAVGKATPPVYPDFQRFDFKLVRDKKTKLKMKLLVKERLEVERIQEALTNHSKLFKATNSFKVTKNGYEANFDLILKLNNEPPRKRN